MNTLDGGGGRDTLFITQAQAKAAITGTPLPARNFETIGLGPDWALGLLDLQTVGPGIDSITVVADVNNAQVFNIVNAPNGLAITNNLFPANGAYVVTGPSGAADTLTITGGFATPGLAFDKNVQTYTTVQTTGFETINLNFSSPSAAQVGSSTLNVLSTGSVSDRVQVNIAASSGTT